ncbi:MAG: restriction endonuclease subunit S [Acetilactobacillus jinshanensis]
MINLKEFKQSVLQKAMQGKLTKQLPSDGNASDLLVKIANKKRDLVQAGKLKGYSKPLPPITDKEKPFKIPDNWEWTKLGNVCKLINGRAYKKKEFLTDNSLTPVLRVGNLFTDKAWYYSNLKLPAKNYVHYGDLIYSWSASFGPRIWKGPTAIFHYHIWKVNFFSQYLNELYLFYVLLNATHLAKLQSHGTSMKHITMHRMNRIPVPIPPLSEQKRIVAKVHKCFELADTIQKERELNKKFAHDMKQSLLMEAMQGKLTKQLPSDGNADELLQKIQQKKQELIKAGKIRRHKKLPPISKDEIPFNIPKNWKWVRLGNISLISSGLVIPI